MIVESEKLIANSKPKREIQLAPKSSRIIFVGMLVDAFLIFVFLNCYEKECIVVAFVYSAFSIISIKLFNNQWLHDYHQELSLLASGLDADVELFNEYENDYTKKYKYSTQRMLAQKKLQQVNDEVGSVIYSVGRFTNQEIIDALERELDTLESKLESVIKVKEEQEKELSIARLEVSEAQRKLMIAEKEREKAIYEMNKAIQEHDKILEEWQREIIGEKITEQIELEEAKRKLSCFDGSIKQAMNITIDDINPDLKITPEGKPKKLSKRQEQEIIDKLGKGWKQKEVAELYGVTQGYISRLKNKE